MIVRLGLLLLVSVNAVAACPQWPLVIAHRGASADRPEHSQAAYQLALEQGADIIEADLVPTKDGVLISRHENELSTSTDIAQHAEFASRKTRKKIDGLWIDGWFSEDLTLAEIRRLKVRETLAKIRPQSATFDGQQGVMTLAEILQLLVRHRQQTGRDVGLYLETKHPTYFANEGHYLAAPGEKSQPIAHDVSALLLTQLQQFQAILPQTIYLQSFEVANLWWLKQQLPRQLPAVASHRVKLIQLLGDTTQAFMLPKDSFSQPYDWVYWQQQGDMSRYQGLRLTTASNQTTLHYGDLVTPDGLAQIALYADGIGPWRNTLAAPSADSEPLLELAKTAALRVHPYTFRPEQPYLRLDQQQQPQSMALELAWLFRYGIDGVFTDKPSQAIAVRQQICQK